MMLHPKNIYHIYNRGNNRQVIFPQERNYDFFLKKAVKELRLHVEFLAYCLMPNHFHFLVYANSNINSRKFSNSFGTLLSSYTRGIQKQEGIIGSLFQQNSKAKQVTDSEYANTCFHYIHQNPLRASLVNTIEAWPHHSFREYWKEEKGICNVELARELLAIPVSTNQFYNESYAVLADELGISF